MKKVLSLVLCAVLLCSIALMPAMAEEGKKTKVTIGIGNTAESFGPFITSSNVIKMVHNMIYMQLGNVDPTTGELVPNMYTSLEETGDMHYVIKLYDDIYDNEGNHITAADVAYSFETAKAAATNQPFSYFANPVATDEYTFEFDMVTDAVTSRDQVLSVVPIVSKAAYEASADQMSMKAVTCAPYLIREFVPGSHVTLEKNANYWCKDFSRVSKDKTPTVDVIEIRFITEAAQLAIALQQHTVDVAIEVNATVAKQFESDPMYRVEYAPSNLYWNMYFDVRPGHVFENEKLRQAVCYAVDQDSVMYGALQGAGWVDKAIASPYSADYNKEWDERDYYDYNPEKASQLLAEAGYKPGDLTINLMCQWEMTKPAAEVVQAFLEEIGIHSNIICPDTALFSTYQNCFSDVWDISIMFWAAKTIGAASMNAQFNRDVQASGITFSGINDDELQRLVLQAISDKTYSAETYNELQDYLKDKAYAYGLYCPQNGYVLNKNITEMYVDGNGRFLPSACTYSADYDVYE